MTKWTYVDFERGYLHPLDSKTGRKSLPLGANARQVLGDMPRINGNDYVCAGEKPGAYLVGLQKAWERLRRCAGLDDLRFYDVRHAFASVAATRGGSLLVIGVLLGLKDHTSTAQYADLQDDPIRAAAVRVSGQIDAAMRQMTSAVVSMKRKG